MNCILFFYARWDNNCIKFLKKIDLLKKEFRNITFVLYDIDNNQILLDKYNIDQIPTLVLMKNNKEINRVIGVTLIKPLRHLLRGAYE